MNLLLIKFNPISISFNCNDRPVFISDGILYFSNFLFILPKLFIHYII